MISAERLRNMMVAASMASEMERQRERILRERAEMRSAVMRGGYRPAWKAIDAHVSAVPDAAYPYDTAILRAIREFDPNVIPLMVTKVYKAQTGEVRTFRFHAIASRRWNPSERPAAWTHKVLLPTWCSMPTPTHMDMHLENRMDRPVRGLPGGYLPFDWGVYHGLREMYQEWTWAEKQAYLAVHSPEARAEREREKVEADREHEATHNRSLNRHLANIDEHDLKRLAAQAADPDHGRSISIVVP